MGEGIRCTRVCCIKSMVVLVTASFSGHTSALVGSAQPVVCTATMFVGPRDKVTGWHRSMRCPDSEIQKPLFGTVHVASHSEDWAVCGSAD